MIAEVADNMNLQETFEKFDNESNRFHLIENKLSTRRDLCGFLYLEKLCPAYPERDIDLIAASDRVQIYLSTDCDELAKVATEEDVLYLCRCGIFYDDDQECLSMFV